MFCLKLGGGGGARGWGGVPPSSFAGVSSCRIRSFLFFVLADFVELRSELFVRSD